MSQDKIASIVKKELEDYKRYIPQEIGDFFSKKNIKKKFHMVLIEMPKNFDITNLENHEINLKDKDPQILIEDEDKNVIIEQQDKTTEEYLCNQVLPVIPSKDSSLVLSKKIHKVFKVYTKYNTKSIKKKNIIRQIPLSENN